MKVSVFSGCFSQPLVIGVPNENPKLANLLSILNSEKITGLGLGDDESMTQLPDALGLLDHLTSLEITRCHALVSFPESLARCACLKRLSIHDCADFSDLAAVSHLSSLEFLSVSGCDGIRSVSESVLSLKKLRALDLSYCESLGWIDLDKLPEGLRILDLHGSESADFEDSCADAMRLVSLKIQSYSDGADWDHMPALENISRKLRRSVMPRRSSGLDE